MTSQLVECLQCQAPLRLLSDQRFCQCEYCGTKFVVALAQDRAPRLSTFTSVVSAADDDAALCHAQQRRADLELALADAEDEVEYRQAELEDSRADYWRTRVNLQRLVAPLQNTTYLAGLLAAFAAFATLFVFRRVERLPGAAIAALLAGTGWAFHREWRETEGEGQSECQEAREAIAEAQAELDHARAQLQNGRLEQELLQQQLTATAPPSPAPDEATVA